MKRRHPAAGFKLRRGQTQGLFFLTGDKGHLHEKNLTSVRFWHLCDLPVPLLSPTRFLQPSGVPDSSRCSAVGRAARGAPPLSSVCPKGAPPETPSSEAVWRWADAGRDECMVGALTQQGQQPMAGTGPAARPGASPGCPGQVSHIPTAGGARGS